MTLKRAIIGTLAIVALLIAFVIYQCPEPPVRAPAPQPRQQPEPPAPAPPVAPAPNAPRTIPEMGTRVAPPPPAPWGAQALIISPLDGAIVARRFTVKMALRGMTLEPAGSVAPGAGHFHLLIDGAPVSLTAPFRRDARHIDIGSGAAEVEIELPSGQHTLQLLIGDGNHVPHDPPIFSTPISVTVGAPQAPTGREFTPTPLRSTLGNE